MKYKMKKWAALLLVLSVLCALPGIAAGATEKAEGKESETAFAFRMKAELPLLKGKRSFRFTEWFPGFFPAQGFLSPSLPSQKDAKTDDITLCPDGSTFGVRLFTEGVLVVGVNENEAVHPAFDAGIRVRDQILQINGKSVKSVQEVTREITASGGSPLSVLCKRGGKEITFTITPHSDEGSGGYKAGLWIRDSAAGIGTVTFFDPSTGAFGGLGHGICDIDTGILVPISRGTVTETEITEIVRGQPGKPGELRGFLKNEKIGALLTNTDCGVFGVLSPSPSPKEEMKILPKNELHCGKAVIRCALGGIECREYNITVSDIDRKASGSKCFSIKIDDAELIQTTGGIIQGMSGSPIIQDGKLAGAVTHVLIGDPTRGFGIFIENMLSAMPSSL